MLTASAPLQQSLRPMVADFGAAILGPSGIPDGNGMNAPAQEFISAQDLRRFLRERVYAEINPTELLEIMKQDPERVRRKLIELVDQIVSEQGYLIPVNTQAELQDYVVDEVLGYGPIDQLLRDPQVEEVMVNRLDEVWVARRIKQRVQMEKTAVCFDDQAHVMHVIDRIIAPIGRRVDESSPRLDARLPDGSRVNVIIPPLALDGATITIRKFPEISITIHDMIHRYNTLSPEMADFLEICVQGRLNILISGGTASGKTTLLNALSMFIDDEERIITIEDTAELRVHQHKPHVVRLESRAPNLEGKGAVTIRDLVVNSLRMRPDRIVVGECRAEETVDMLQAMNTGHDGSITTVHANSPQEAIHRLEIMFLMSGLKIPVVAIRQQVSMAIQLVVQVRRMRDGSRKVTSIAEVHGMGGDQVNTTEIFKLENDKHVYTGAQLQALPKLRLSLEELPPLAVFG